jgi:hypothetical protein
LTAYTSAAAGNWDVSTNWNPNGVPTNGDTVTLTNFDITANEDVTIGNSPAAGNTVVTINSGRTLTLAAGKVFTVRGDIDVATANIVMPAGSTLEFDSSAAAAPATTYYQLHLGTGHNQGSKLTCNGTSGSHCTIRSVSGSGYGWINDGTGPWLGGGLIDATYTDFIRVGNSTNPAWRVSASGSYSTTLTNCTFNSACGGISSTYSLGGDCTFKLDHVNHAGSVMSPALYLINSSAKTSGTRLIDSCYFAQMLQLFSVQDVTFTNNVLNDFIQMTAGGGTWASFSDNFIRFTSASGGGNIYYSLTNNYCYYDGSGDTNVHFVNCLGTATHDGNIFQFNGADDQGDCYLLGAPGGAITVAITHNVILPNVSSLSTGTLFSALGNANVTFSATKNVYLTGTQGAAVGETYTGHAGMLSSFKDNIAWDSTAGRGYKLYDSGVDDAVTDLVTSANANYNCGYNLLAGSNLKGYNHLEFTAGSPGANDVDVDPKFVNKNANLASYDAGAGGAGTDANALTELRKMGLSTFNSSYLPSKIVSYIKRAFLPTNKALKGKASDGTTIGLGGFGGKTAGLLLLDAG